MRPRALSARATALALLLASPAGAATLRLTPTAAAPGSEASMGARVDLDEECLGAVGFEVVLPPEIDLLAVEAAGPECLVASRATVAGVRIAVTCPEGATDGGQLLTMRLALPAGLPFGDLTLEARDPEAIDCGAEVAALTLEDGVLTVGGPGCSLGDVFPRSDADGEVDLRDWMFLRRLVVLGSEPVQLGDLGCGDLAPGERCPGGAAPVPYCPSPDDRLDSRDLRELRSLSAGLTSVSCEPCLLELPGEGAAARRAGDVAPRAESDGFITVGDAVLVLRWSVGLDLPVTAEELLRADVAPSPVQAGLRVVGGDGALTIGDAVLILRASVGLERLAWPLRSVLASLDDAISVAGWSVAISGWPPFAEVESALGPGCDPAQGGGVDEADGSCTVTCASDPATVDGPAELFELTYRSPEPVDVGALVATPVLADAALALQAGGVSLSEPED